MNRAVVPEPSPVDNAGGGVVSYQITRIQTTEDLERELSINAEASYGCAAFGAGISARFDFCSKQKVQSSSLFLAVTAKVELGFQSIDDVRLGDAAANLKDRPDVFKDRYGTMFVRGIGRGGLFVGIVRIDTRNSSESNDISASVSGSYGLFSADASTKFKELQEKFQSNININIYHEGGPINLAIRDTQNPVQLLEAMNAFLDSFQNTPDQVSVPYFVTLAPLTIAEGPLPLNSADLQQAQDTLAACTKARSRIMDKINLLGFVLERPQDYKFAETVGQAQLQATLDHYQRDLDMVARCASNAINSPAEARMPAPFADRAEQAEGRGAYVWATLPDPMPEPKAAAPVSVPDFSTCKSWTDCVARAAERGLTAEQVIESTQPKQDAFTIVSVDPPGGAVVPAGTVVRIHTMPTKIGISILRLHTRAADNLAYIRVGG